MLKNRSQSRIDMVKRTKSIALRSILTVIGIVLGILVTAQWNSIPERVTNPIAPYTSLKETKDSLYDEQADLKKEIANLQESIDSIQKESLNSSLTKDQLVTLKDEKAKAGITSLNGQGIILTLDDSKNGISSEDSIIHAADLRDVINLLWGSGAEAISINGQRVVVNTAIDCIVNTILVNDSRIASPFRIEAIGDQSYMYDNLINPLILSNIHDRNKNQGIVFDLSKNDDITVPAFDGSYDVKAEGVLD